MSDGTDRDSRDSSNSDGCARCGVWCTCNKYSAKTSFSLSTTTSLTPKKETIERTKKDKTEKED